MSNTFYTNAHQSQIHRLIPDLIRARQLLLDLIWKDIRVRYRYAAMGFAWAVLEPLIMMLVLTFVFSFVLNLRFDEIGAGGGRGYDAVFILTGLIAWQFLATSLTSATTSLVDNRSLITKVNFPREVIPLATIGVAVVNFAIGSVLLLVLYLLLVGGFPGPGLLWVVPIFLIQLAIVAGLSLLCSTFNAAFRDISYMVNAALLFGFYATPIFYQPSLVRGALTERGLEAFYPMYFMNPMAGLIMAYRQALFEGRLPDLMYLAWPALCAAGVLALGIVAFRKRSPTLADQL